MKNESYATFGGGGGSCITEDEQIRYTQQKAKTRSCKIWRGGVKGGKQGVLWETCKRRMSNDLGKWHSI